MGWIEQEALRCSMAMAADVTPPAALRLSMADGGSCGETSEAGLYRRLDDKRTADGGWIWKHTSQPRQWLSMTPESGAACFAQLLDGSCRWPFEPCCASGVATVEEACAAGFAPSRLVCAEADAAELPPPLVLRLEGATEEAALPFMGLYRLVVGLRANERPVWQLTSRHGIVLAYTGWSWNVQSERDLGQSSGVGITVKDKSPTPDLVSATWKAHGHSVGWIEQEALRCVVAGDAETIVDISDAQVSVVA